ncbi:hypothetical protein PCASD_17449 [Puccinia coronata f. sp. avenae]|uniref:Uncharacterized protein n=1 Tax=Puccinia coronata f. sp. avenae TaxID=200324 RepID=A0A2N5TS62_9BASI|nr:hypothetical protein PCASD_17449 [Puccinia coronata f. sp. avenae]
MHPSSPALIPLTSHRNPSNFAPNQNQPTTTNMLHTPKQPNTTTSNSSSSGVVVPPEVWEQMQCLLSTFGPSNTINPSPSQIIRQSAPLLATSSALSSFPPPQLADNKSTSSQLISPSNPSSDEDNAFCSTLAPPFEDLEPPVKNDVPTKNQRVADWTLEPVNNTTTVDGVILDIKHYKFASGRLLWDK